MARRQYDPYAPRKRPWELVVVVVLCCIQAAIEVATGLLLILDRFTDEFDAGGASVVTLIGAATVFIGLFIIAVASGIFRGDRVARIALTLLLVLDLATDYFLAVEVPGQVLPRVASAILSVAILVVVWTGRRQRYFAYRRA